MSHDLSPRQVESMKAVAEGADVIDYGIAMDLRQVQRRYPEYVTVGKPMHRYAVKEKRAYFGAILTDAGRVAVGLMKPSLYRPELTTDIELLREKFERLNRDSHGFKRSSRGTYVNPAVARDWKWFQLGSQA